MTKKKTGKRGPVSAREGDALMVRVVWTEDEKRHIKAAAALSGETIGQFMVEAALTRSQEYLK